MKNSRKFNRLQPEQSFKDLIFSYPHLIPMVKALGLHAPYGESSLHQICKAQNVHEPVLISLLEAVIYKDFEVMETLPAYGLLQLGEVARLVVIDLINQLSESTIRDMLPVELKGIQEQFVAYSKELEHVLLPHMTAIYELYYSPEYTSGKSNLLSYSIEFFPQQKLPHALLVDSERAIEYLVGEDWEVLLGFHRFVELALAVERLEEHLLKPLVLRMEEDVILSFQKTKNKTMRVAFLSLPESEPKPHLLSNREQEVLSLVAQGLMNKEIADRLSISLTTVISHRKNLIAKLGIHTLAGLTVYAYTHGFLDDDILINED